MTTPNIDTKALRELEAKATPGPWESSYFGDGQFVVRMPRDRSLRFHRRPPSGSDDQAATVYGAPGIAKVLPGDVIVGVAGHELDGLTEQEYANQRVADGQLIVALRNAAPALLDLAERAQEMEGMSRALGDAETEASMGSIYEAELETKLESVEAERDALKAEVERLKAERDGLSRALADMETEEAQGRLHLEAKLSASEREVERLRAALERERPSYPTFTCSECCVPSAILLDGRCISCDARAALRGEEAPRGE